MESKKIYVKFLLENEKEETIEVTLPYILLGGVKVMIPGVLREHPGYKLVRYDLFQKDDN